MFSDTLHASNNNIISRPKNQARIHVSAFGSKAIRCSRPASMHDNLASNRRVDELTVLALHRSTPTDIGGRATTSTTPVSQNSQMNVRPGDALSLDPVTPSVRKLREASCKSLPLTTVSVINGHCGRHSTSVELTSRKVGLIENPLATEDGANCIDDYCCYDAC